MSKCLSFIISLMLCINVFAQKNSTTIQGRVINEYSRTPIEFVSILIEGTTLGAISDSLGNFKINGVEHGIIKLRISSLGYKTLITPDYIISLKTPFIEIALEEDTKQLDGVTITAGPSVRKSESPVSLRIIELKDIEKMPGANRDISRIVRSYPGVSFSPIGYRNDLIVRGGGPAENRFFMDGIEIPNINHFSTQGASGGPVSIINSDLVRDINFYTGAFPANRGGALSSIMDFNLRDGNPQKSAFKATLGASEASFSGSGAITDKTTYLFSLRQSYLQLLFKALGLPFLPNYIDGQFKIKSRLSSTNEITLLGLMGIDRMKLNLDYKKESAEYLLSYLPVIEQNTYTLGASYKHYNNHNIFSAYISTSRMENSNTKYIDNDDSNPDKLRLRLNSFEQKSNMRAEYNYKLEQWNIRTGLEASYFHYHMDYNQLLTKGVYDKYITNLGRWMWGGFIMANFNSASNKFTSSFGIRVDGCDYNNMRNVLDHISPRVSMKYAINNNISLAVGTGIYYQLPAYTSLGYKENGTLINKELKYMKVAQINGGAEIRINEKLAFNTELFYKRYTNIPMSVVDNIPLACKGDDYGVVGNERLIPSSLGRAYGVEIMGNYNLSKGTDITGSLTIFKSQYKKDKESDYINSAWDNGFILNLSAMKELPRQWMIGTKLSYIGGAPYTPYDIERSSLVQEWDKRGKAYLDYSQYNTLTRGNFYQLDVRVDKSWYFKKWMLGVYIDVQNITKSTLKEPDTTVSTGVIEDTSLPLSEQRYQFKYLKQESGTVVPTIGVTLEF